jgi:hypothetical protein
MGTTGRPLLAYSVEKLVFASRTVIGPGLIRRTGW